MPACASTCAAAANSDGLLADEYAPQEQDDALEVIAWLARAALVQRRGRHDGHLLGRLQRAAGRGAPAAGAEGDHHALLDRRPLRRRHALHGRRAAERQASAGASFFFGVDVPPARSRARRRALARDVAGAAGEPAAVPARSGCGTSGATPIGGTARCARTTRAIQCPVYRRRRLDRRLHQRDPAPARRICRCRARG